MENVAWYVYLVFGLTVLLAAWLFIKATHYSRTGMVLITLWVLLQSGLGISGFYSGVHTVTARFPLLVLPPLVFFISRFFTASGRAFIDGLDLRTLTLLHVIRIPVELVLLWLFLYKSIPQAMTFEGRNFDIISGVSAPLIWYFGFVQQKTGRKLLIAWNVLCILLLLNVVSSAVLSLPDRYQQFGFERANTAIGYFPFVLLPALLVPLVLFANLAAIRQLVRQGAVR